MLEFAELKLPKIKNTNTLEDMVRNVAKTDPEKLYLLVLGIVGLFTHPKNTGKDKPITISDLANVFSALAVLANEEKEGGASGTATRIKDFMFDIVQTLASAGLLGYLLEHPSQGTAATHARPALLF